MRAKSVDKQTLWLLLAIFPACSFAGLAALLRSDQPISRRAVASACLNSGFFGVCIAAAMIHRYGTESIYLTLSISVMAGLGGNTLLDFAIEGIKSYVRNQS